MADKPEVISTDKARAGTTPRIVRYILIISSILAVAAMVGVYIGTDVASQPDSATGSDPDSVSVPTAAEQR